MSRELTVEYRNGEIVVTQPGTAFSASYIQPDGHPNLLLSAASVDPGAKPGEIFQFQSYAFEAAMRKARELGWIAA
jgi:hypothetical protein